MTVRDLGVPEQPRVRFSILPTTRSGRYLLLQPNDVVTREINKVNFQIIKYQKLTSLHPDDVGGVYWACPLPTLLMDRFTGPGTSFLSRVQVGLKLGVVDVLVCCELKIN